MKKREGGWPFAQSWGLTPPTGPDSDHQDELNKLNGLSGADFDIEYIGQMVTDHSKALSGFTTETKDTKDLKFRSAVLKGKTAVAAHKNMAYEFKKKTLNWFGIRVPFSDGGHFYVCRWLSQVEFLSIL